MATAPGAKKRGAPRRDDLVLDTVVFGLQAIKLRDGRVPDSLITLFAEKLSIGRSTIRRRLYPPVDTSTLIA